MAIEIDQVDGWMMHTLYVGGEPLMGFRCESAARHAASKLTEARTAGPRRAMHILTTEFGMCEDAARHVIELLAGHSSTLN